MKNHYQTLGVDPRAKTNEIKSAFRKLALKFHPDKNNGDKIFEEKFREIREAYEVLIDPAEKGRYDLKFKHTFVRRPAKPKVTKTKTSKKKPNVSYSDDELAEFKKRILLKLELAKKELNYLQELIITEKNTELTDMLPRQITYIENLEKALARIENKTYGICSITGKLIEKNHLYNMPHATMSAAAKYKQFKG